MSARPPLPLITPSTTLYAQVAQRLAQLIHSGLCAPGHRLPSVRETAQQEGVSMATAKLAYEQLVDQGLAEARPRTGYFVRRQRSAAPRARAMAPPRHNTPPQRSVDLTLRTRSDAFALLHQPGDRACFGGYTPQGNGLFDEDGLRVAMARAARVHRSSLVEYNKGDAGTLALRQAVARRAHHLGCTLEADDIVITASCTQAVSLCLSVITRPGDVVAIESPTFFGHLDLLESLGLRALEIPTHPRTGVSLPALELALDTQAVKAVLLTPTLSNPLGSVMPLAAKRRLVQLLAERGVPLIEDVVFNDLLASDERRKAAKAFDTQAGVMMCGSFAKTVSPGIRLGWAAPGRWREQVATRKRLQGAATNVVMEHALADLLQRGSYETHMRRLRTRLTERLGQAREQIARDFPAGTRVSNPPSGYSLWVELPSTLDSMALFERCVARGVTFGPGPLFTATNRYRHGLRLSFSGAWGDVERQALTDIGQLATDMAKDLSQVA